MENSILKSVKKTLNVDVSFTGFDIDILMHINSTFAVLNQLGVGPVDGFMIEDDSAEWADFYGDDPRWNLVRSAVYLRVRMLFDPPTTGYLVTALEKQLLELETRLSYYRETTEWTEPVEVA